MATETVGFVCTFRDECPLCKKDMVPSKDRVLPIHHGDGKWGHVHCAKIHIEPKSERAVCRHWRRRGECVYGEDCFFKHPENQRGEMKDQVRERRKWGGRRVEVRNRNRVSTFRRFLVDTLDIGDETKVLDVAGGKGELGFELLNLRGIQTTVVEPRALSTIRFAKRFLKGCYHRNSKFSASKYVTRTPEDDCIPVDHIRIFLDHDLLRKLGMLPESEFDMTESELNERIEDAKTVAMTRRGLCTHECEKECDENDDDATTDGGDDFSGELSNSITDFEMVIERLTGFDLVCGMHPDQATEPLVDLALAMNKPFAVVPCCIYSAQFPSRRLVDGSQVTTYEQFLQYLVEKDPENIKIQELDFEGKNKVVFRKTVRVN